MMLSRRSALLGLAALPASCASPNPSLYVLAAVPGPVHRRAPRVIQLHAIAVAHYLERSQIVRSSEGYRMEVLSNDWWGEPLDAMISRILVMELNQRLPGSTVYGESGAISTPPDASVEINLQRFDMDRQGNVLLNAQVAVDSKTLTSRGVTFSARPTDNTTAAMVAAMSTEIGQLADVLAGMLTSR